MQITTTMHANIEREDDSRFDGGGGGGSPLLSTRARFSVSMTSGASERSSLRTSMATMREHALFRNSSIVDIELH